MADNITPPGFTVPMATDEKTGGIHVQRVTLDQGGDGGEILPLPAAGAPDTGNPIKVGGRYNLIAPILDDGDRGDLPLDINGYLLVTLARLLAGENLSVNRMMVEHQYVAEARTTSGALTGPAKFVHTISISPTTATPTAGLVTIYDNSSGAGTIVYQEYVPATVLPHTIIVDSVCNIGCYVSIAAVGISVSISKRI